MHYKREKKSGVERNTENHHFQNKCLELKELTQNNWNDSNIIRKYQNVYIAFKMFLKLDKLCQK